MPIASGHDARPCELSDDSSARRVLVFTHLSFSDNKDRVFLLRARARQRGQDSQHFKSG
jgi:hypothetical protein